MKEIRSASIAAGDDLHIEGMPIVFDTPTRIGGDDGFNEVITRGALDGCDMSDSTLTVNHDESRIPLARVPKTMQFTVTDRGLRMAATLAGESQQAREVYTSIKRGDLKGMSFAFLVAPDGSRYDATTNTRTITKIAKILECSICSHPAYAETSVEARSQVEQGQQRMAALRLAGKVRAKLLIDRILNKE